MTYVATVIALQQGISADVETKFEALLRAEGVTTLRMAPLNAGKVVDYYLDFDDALYPEIKTLFFEFSSEHKGVDVVLQRASEEFPRRERGLFVFDMDSTLIQQEVIDMIAAYANVEDEVSVRT